jgi:drug/metabolite transporter (DMT)-like permease
MNRLAYVAWLAVCLMWGTTYLAIRIALETVPPTLLGGIRFFVAGLILCAVVRVRGGGLPPPREWPAQAVLGALMIAMGNGFVVWAERWIPSGIAAVGVASLPFWMSGVEAVSGGERLARRAFAGLCLGFGGIVLLIWPSVTDRRTGGEHFVLGILLVQLACLGWAVGSSYSKRRLGGHSALADSALQQLAGGTLLLLAGTALGEWRSLAFTPRTLGAEIYLIVFGSLAAYSAYLYALQHLSIATVSLYAYVNPIIAVALGSVIADEPFTPRIAAAAAMVLAGVTVVRSAKGGP